MHFGHVINCLLEMCTYVHGVLCYMYVSSHALARQVSRPSLRQQSHAVARRVSRLTVAASAVTRSGAAGFETHLQLRS